MRLPADEAVIPTEKLRDYILSATHAEGRGKASYLDLLGYNQSNWRRLETDLREQHLVHDAQPGRPSPYGDKFEILAPLTGPNGETGLIRTIWIVLRGEKVPRFVTLIPEERP